MAYQRRLTRYQIRVLEALLGAAEEDNMAPPLIAATELPGFATTTLKSLERRNLAVLADASEHPFLWRITLRGLLEARRLRGVLPRLEGWPA